MNLRNFNAVTPPSVNKIFIGKSATFFVFCGKKKELVYIDVFNIFSLNLKKKRKKRKLNKLQRVWNEWLICFFLFSIYYFQFFLPQESVTQNDANRQGRNYSEKENTIVGSQTQVEESLLKKLNEKCARRDSSACAMLKLIAYMNRLFKKANIDLTENIEITQTTAVTELRGEFSASQRIFSPLQSSERKKKGWIRLEAKE